MTPTALSPRPPQAAHAPAPSEGPQVTGASALAPVEPTTGRLLAYGGFATPLAFAALPLYVQWPAHAAGTWGMSLATLGALLLAVRLGDAFIDPWIGSRIDTLFERSARRAWLAAGVAAACVACGLVALMFAPDFVLSEPRALLAWAAAALVLTSLGYSVATVTHQAWAVRLGGGSVEQARWVGTREALALAGVILASVLPAFAGWPATLGTLSALALLSWLSLARVQPRLAAHGAPAAHAAEVRGAPALAGRNLPRVTTSDRPDLLSPWRDRGFRRLVPIVLLGGLASAMPASLVVLYVRDVLAAGGAAEGWALGLYFVAGAAAMPLWVRAVGRFGLLRTWLAGMCIAIGAFAGAAVLGPGDLALFALVCVASGLALGADLVVPPALLAGLIQRRSVSQEDATASGDGARRGVEGRWFGWWNFLTKLTLAGAAGISLPLVQWLGYSPGAQDARSLAALAFCYAVLPCGIKALAAAMLWSRRETWPWTLHATAASRTTP